MSEINSNVSGCTALLCPLVGNNTNLQQEVFVCDVGSAIAQLFQVAQPLKNCPVSDIQIVSKKHYQSLLGDRQKAYKIGLAFTRTQEDLLCELETTQNELDQKNVELVELHTEHEARCKRSKQDLAVSVGALLKEQDDKRQAVDGLNKIIVDLRKELERCQKKHKHDDDDPNISIISGYGELGIRKKRQRTGSPARRPHSKQSDTLTQLVSASQTTPRTVYIKFTRYHRGIDELMSEIIPGRVESVYWNTPSPGHRFAFVNFISRPDARQFLDYVDRNPTHLPVGLSAEWGLKLKPMTPAVVEAIIDHGATRILHIIGVPLEAQHGDIWRMAGKTTFRFVRVIQKREHSVDIVLEFNSVDDALQGKEMLVLVGQLKLCRFEWGKNVTDHLVEGFVKTKSGNGRVIRIGDVRV